MQGNCAHYPQIQVLGAKNVSGPDGSGADLSNLDDGLHLLSQTVLIEPKRCKVLATLVALHFTPLCPI